MKSEEKQSNVKNIKIIGQVFSYTTIYIDENFIVEPTTEILEQIEENKRQIEYIKKKIEEESSEST